MLLVLSAGRSSCGQQVSAGTPGPAPVGALGPTWLVHGLAAPQGVNLESQ